MCVCVCVCVVRQRGLGSSYLALILIRLIQIVSAIIVKRKSVGAHPVHLQICVILLRRAYKPQNGFIQTLRYGEKEENQRYRDETRQ